MFRMLTTATILCLAATAPQASPHRFGANTLDLSAAPRISATGTAAFSAGGTSSLSFTPRGGGTMYLEYYMVVNGLGGLTSIPVQTTAEAEIEVSRGRTNVAAADAGAEVSITGPGGPLLVLAVNRAYDSLSGGGSYEDGFSVDQLLNFQASEIYQILMRVNASNGINNIPVGTEPEPELSPVPLPAGAPLLGAALALLAVARRHRSR